LLLLKEFAAIRDLLILKGMKKNEDK